MGHRPAIQLTPEKIPGVIETFTNGVTIDTASMTPGNERTKLEEILKSFKNDMYVVGIEHVKLFLFYRINWF